MVRNIPGRPWLRASVGAWNDEERPRAAAGGAAERERPPQARQPPTPQASDARAERDRAHAAARPGRRARPASAPPLRHLGAARRPRALGGAQHHRLSQNGYANIFYSAGVQSMLRSLHNFLFVSFDPGGLVTVDKPPLGAVAAGGQRQAVRLLAAQPAAPRGDRRRARGRAAVRSRRAPLRRGRRPDGRARARRVPLLRRRLARQRRRPAADPADARSPAAPPCAHAKAGAGARCCGCAVLVGLAFNTKTLAAYLVVPGIALALPRVRPRHARAGASLQLLVAGARDARRVVRRGSPSWNSTPASKRPYVGGSTDNTELGLTFEYNGFGRVEGQAGGPGSIPVGAARCVPARRGRSRRRARASDHGSAQARTGTAPATPPPAPHRRARRRPTGANGTRSRSAARPGRCACSASASATRAAGCSVRGLRTARPARARRCSTAPRRAEPARMRSRRDPRLAALLVLGGWFVVEAVVLSLSKGIVHPYYVSALAPRRRGDGRRRRGRARRARAPPRWRLALALAPQRSRTCSRRSCCCTASTTCSGSCRC